MNPVYVSEHVDMHRFAAVLVFDIFNRFASRGIDRLDIVRWKKIAGDVRELETIAS